MAEEVLGRVGIKPDGNYDPNKNYGLLIEVLYNHDSWVSKHADNQGNTPADGSAHWQRQTNGGEAAYNAAVEALTAAEQASITEAAALAIILRMEEQRALEDGEVAYADFDELPKLCGQPMRLFGAGTPQEGVIPDNWLGLDKGGYEWTGVPSAIGQEYINTTASSGGRYIAVRDGYLGLRWLNA